MYVTNYNNNNVNIIDILTHTIAGTVDVGNGPNSLGLAGTGMYVANFDNANINIIDITTLKIAGTVAASSPFFLAFTEAETEMYVTNSGSDVSVIDLTTFQTVDVIDPQGLGCYGVAVAGTGMYVANAVTNNVAIIDTTTHDVVNLVDVGNEPTLLALDGQGQMYVLNHDSNNVSIIDTLSQTVIHTVNVGNGPDGLALSGTGMYVANINSGTINVIDITNAQVGGTITVGGSPSKLAIAGTELYATDVSNGSVLIINLLNNQLIDTIPFGGLPSYLYLATYPPTPLPPSPPLLSTGLSGNVRKTAAYIDASQSPSLLTWFAPLSPNERVKALEATCGSRNHASFFSSELVLQIATRSLMAHIRQRQNFFPLETSSPLSAYMIASTDEVPPCKIDRKQPTLSLWALNTAEYAHLKKDPNNNPAIGLFSDTSLLGIDYQTPERQLVGGMVGYSHIHTHTQNNSGHSSSNLYMASVYSDLFWNHFYLSPGCIGAFNATSQMRRIKFTGFDAKAFSKPFAWMVDPHIELGYEIVCKSAVLAPFSLLDWTFSWQRSYNEHGASPFTEKSPSQIGSLLRSETGLRSFQHFCLSWGHLFLIEKASYVFLKPFRAGNIQTGFVGTPDTFSVVYANQPLNLGALGVDISFLLGKNNPTQIRLGFEGEAGSRYWSSQATLELMQRF